MIYKNQIQNIKYHNNYQPDKAYVLSHKSKI